MLSFEHKNVWYGARNKIQYEINNFKFSENDRVRWTYYLSIPLELIPNELGSEGYMGIKRDSELHELEWHGGVTYCEREGTLRIKIGCDFSHYHDQGRVYTLESVSKELENTLNLFVEKFIKTVKEETK
jgi:hypothetical protein